MWIVFLRHNVYSLALTEIQHNTIGLMGVNTALGFCSTLEKSFQEKFFMWQKKNNINYFWKKAYRNSGCILHYTVITKYMSFAPEITL